MNNRAVVSLKCRENGNAHVQVSDCRSRIRDGKDEGLVISRLFANPIKALSLDAKFFQTPLSLIKTLISNGFFI